jgi:hypothetical protein
MSLFSLGRASAKQTFRRALQTPKALLYIIDGYMARYASQANRYDYSTDHIYALVNHILTTFSFTWYLAYAYTHINYY